MKKHNGFVMVAAIFLLVVLAALAGFIVSFSNVQHLTSAQDLQGSRAYWAARAGMEWAMCTIQANCSNTAPDCAAYSTTVSEDLTNIEGLEDFTIRVGISCRSYNEGGADDKKIFEVSSTAFSGGDVGSLTYIERSVSASAEF